MVKKRANLYKGILTIEKKDKLAGIGAAFFARNQPIFGSVINDPTSQLLFAKLQERNKKLQNAIASKATGNFHRLSNAALRANRDYLKRLIQLGEEKNISHYYLREWKRILSETESHLKAK